MIYIQNKKIDEEIASIRYYCKKCGHTLILSHRVDKLLCNHCGTMFYKNPADEFKAKLKQAQKHS